MTSSSTLLLFATLFPGLFFSLVALQTTTTTNIHTQPTRRTFLATSAATPLLITNPTTVHATEGLADRLAARDPAKLTNSLFNRPPGAQMYPDFMRNAIWDVEAKFAGYIFPSTTIPKEQLLKKETTPGFQKCSIAAIADIGKEGVVKYGFKVDANGLEDRVFNLQEEINAYLGYRAVSEVIYDVKSNPNRISIDFVDYKTINAERIELFCNGRESELQANRPDGKTVFVCSEYIRQVTFGGGSQVGIPRQVSTNYAHYWTWSQKAGEDSVLKGNLLTAAYLDAQDPFFFQEPTKPVAVYSHVLSATKRVG